jgi:putative endonuclease
MPAPGDRRRRALAAGRAAETVAAWLLRLKGYRILARDWRHAAGEIDLIARRGRLLVAVEVKRRGNEAAAADALLARQRRRIARAAEAYRARLPAGEDLSLRFDVVLVVPGRLPRHIIDAWRP